MIVKYKFFNHILQSLEPLFKYAIHTVYNYSVPYSKKCVMCSCWKPWKSEQSAEILSPVGKINRYWVMNESGTYV